ncbi:MAG: 4-hydroxy-tetrahydrodipicolinate synthase [Dysgonamonadaceae bacterium]|jgi:4-hydroxy-tetrahydrodipicolinate synthase|nr:4-hydroxy-tetrahydrodipicolinate synthase [Dysgonamonadaceae bacterium]
MERIDLSGMGVALITPFKSNGDVDFDTLLKLVSMHLSAGTDYLVALGTTAEMPTLSVEERREITRLVTAQVNGKIPVVLGLGGNNTREIIGRLEAEDFTGVDALLSATPYYNKPSQEGLFRHYRALSEASPLPIVLYNVPSRTGVNLCAGTTLRIANECENVIAIKEASGNVSQTGEIVRSRPAGFRVISGDDGMTLPLMSFGVDGVISVLGNAFPKEFGRMVHFALSGDFRSAQAIHLRFCELFGLLSVDGNPAGIKCLMSLRGLCENVLRLPLVPATSTTVDRMTAFLAELGIDL